MLPGTVTLRPAACAVTGNGSRQPEARAPMGWVRVGVPHAREGSGWRRDVGEGRAGVDLLRKRILLAR
jgi:hypothetical protein